MFFVQNDYGTAFSNTNGRVIELSSDSAIKIFEGYSVRNSNLVANELGLFTLQSVGNASKAKWGNLTNMAHVLSPRKNGCSATPKGQVFLGLDETDLYPVEYFGRICPDVFYNNCFEKIFGAGNEINDIFATPEGRAMYDMLQKKSWNAIGNGVHDLAWFGNSPWIDESNDNGWWVNSGITVQQWKDYRDQQTAVTGFITLCDERKARGDANFTVDISSWVDASGNFTGSVIALFKHMVDNAPPMMTTMLEGMEVGKKPNIIVDKQIFQAYKTYLQVTYPALIESYYLLTTGMDGNISKNRNVLEWEGHNIVFNNEFAEFDRLLNIKTRRIILSFPGVFGLSYDIPNLGGQYNGMGMRWWQSPDPEDKGLVKQSTAFKLSAHLLDISLIVYGEHTTTPN